MFIKTWAFCQLKITSPVNPDKIHFLCKKYLFIQSTLKIIT